MEQIEPFRQPLLNASGEIADVESGRSTQGSLPSVAGATSFKQHNSNDISTPPPSQHAAQLGKRSQPDHAFLNLPLKRFSQTIRLIWGKGWTAETFSFIASIMALAGLVATLSAHQHKPLPQWPQLVTINSIISLFSLIMRACVGVVLAEGLSQCKWNWYQKPARLEQMERLDSASRGSWGSLTLLYHLRPQNIYWLAALGALVTIMASLTGFFAQQLVQFQDCAQKDITALTRISRTNFYNRIGGQTQSNVPVDFAPMVAAINVGLLQPPGDLTNTLSSGCSSGNCTFSTSDSVSLSTLTINHLCEDATARIRIVNETMHNTTAPYIEKQLALDYGNNKSFEWSTEQGGLVVESWTDTINSSGLVDIYLIFRPHWTSKDWKAFNCSLSPAISTLAAKISNAVLEEVPVRSVRLQDLADQFEKPSVGDSDYTNLIFSFRYMMSTNTTVRNGAEVLCEGSDNPTAGLVRFMKSSDEPTYVNSTGHANPSVGWKWWYYPRDCVWTISRFSNTAIVESLDEIFDHQNATMGRKGGVMGSAHLRVLFQEGNMTLSTLNERMKGLATSMTTVIRTNGGNGNASSPFTTENASGVVWVNTTCVSIRWNWITFPAVMVGLTGVFLILVAIENRGVENNRLWKSSFLAALFCEIDSHGNAVSKKEMKEYAKSTSVTLERKSGTLRLVPA